MKVYEALTGALKPIADLDEVILFDKLKTQAPATIKSPESLFLHNVDFAEGRFCQPDADIFKKSRSYYQLKMKNAGSTETEKAFGDLSAKIALFNKNPISWGVSESQSIKLLYPVPLKDLDEAEKNHLITILQALRDISLVMEASSNELKNPSYEPLANLVKGLNNAGITFTVERMRGMEPLRLHLDPSLDSSITFAVIYSAKKECFKWTGLLQMYTLEYGVLPSASFLTALPALVSELKNLLKSEKEPALDTQFSNLSL
jgi:hypothetical protein